MRQVAKLIRLPTTRNCVTDAHIVAFLWKALLINALMKTTLTHKQTLTRQSEKSASLIRLTTRTIKRKLPRQIKRKIIDKTPKQQKLLGTFVRDDV